MKFTILSVDDDPVMLKILELVFRKRGLSGILKLYTSAEDCLIYLDMNHHEHEHILMLLDLNMPGMSGWDLLEQLKFKEYQDQVSVVILTSSIAREDRERANLYACVIDYLEKPFRTNYIDRILSHEPDKLLPLIQHAAS